MPLLDTLKNTTGYNMVKSFMNPQQPYEEAEKANNQGWNEAQGYGRPYWQNGLNQTGALNEAEGNLLHPDQLQNNWAKGYETSPYAKQLLDQNMGAGQDAASAMGLQGSSAGVANIQQGAGNIVAQDRQQYMKDLMEKYMAGIGIGQNQYNTGAAMGGTLASGALQHGQDAASLAYGKSAAPGQMFNRLLSTGVGMMSGGAGGGMR